MKHTIAKTMQKLVLLQYGIEHFEYLTDIP